MMKSRWKSDKSRSKIYSYTYLLCIRK